MNMAAVFGIVLERQNRRNLSLSIYLSLSLSLSLSVKAVTNY